MKQTIKLLLAFLVLMVSSTKVWADTTTNDILADGLVTVVEGTGYGTVTAAEAILDNCDASYIKVKIKVKPEPGSFIKCDNVTLTNLNDVAFSNGNNTKSDATTSENFDDERWLEFKIYDTGASIYQVKVTVQFQLYALALKNSFGENVTVDFYDGGISEPTSFDTSGKTKITSIDNSGNDRWIVMDIKPKDGYWVNVALMSGLETGASLAPRRAPGIDALNTVKKIGTGHKANGEGLYCYMIPKEHTVANYKFTGVKGVVIPKFDLSTATYAEATKTFTASNGAGWTADIKLDENSWAYDKTAHSITFDGNIKVKKDDADVCELPYDGNIAVSGEQTNASATAYTASMTAQSNSCFDSSDGKKTKTTSFNIYAKEVGFTWDATSFVYNGSEQKPTPTIKSGDIIAGDVCTISAVSIAAVDPSTLTAEGKSVNAGNYTATVVSLSNDNYIVSPQDGDLGTQNFSITARTVKDNPGTGEGQVNVVLTGVPAEGFTYDGSEQKPTVTVKDGDNEILSTEYTIKYKKGNDDVNSPQDAGTYAVVITDNAGGNYTVSGTATFTIKPKPVGFTWDAASFTYNGSEQKPTASLKAGALVGTDVCDITTTIAAVNPSALTAEGKSVNVGNYTATATALSNTNYVIATTGDDAATKTQNFSITQRNVVIPENPGADDPKITFDIPAAGYTYNGNVQKPTVTVSDGSNNLTEGTDFAVTIKQGTAVEANPKNVGTYTVTIGTGTNGNYTFVGSKDYVIAAKPVGFTWDAASFTYNGSEQKPTASLKDGAIVGSDVCNITTTIAAVAPSALTDGKSVNAGSYTATVTALSNANYVIATTGDDAATKTQTYTIGKRALAVKADAKSKVYGGAEPTLTYTQTGLVEGDAFTGALSRVAGENVGTYAIQQNTLTAGDNYTITYTGADLTITQQIVTIPDNPAATDPVIEFTGKDSGTNTDIPTGGYVYDKTAKKPAVVVKDAAGTVIPADQYTVTYTDNVNAGTNAKVTVSEVSGANYKVSGSKTFTIAKRPLAVKAEAKSKAYGATEPTLTYTQTGLVEGDAITGALSRVAGENVGTYAIQQNTLTAGDNYTITYTGADLTITQQIVTIPDNPAATDPVIEFTGKESGTNTDIPTGGYVYDKTEKKPAVVVKDAAGTVIPAGQYTVTYTDNVNAGTNAKVTVSEKDGANYKVSGSKTFTIAKRPLAVKADAKSKVYGATEPTLTYTQTGLVEGDAITGALSREVGENVGTYAIQQNTLAAGDNYTITYTGADLTITQKSIEIPEGGGTPGGTEPTLTFTNIPTGGYIYDGTEKKPTVEVKDEAGNVIAATEYDVTYANNINAGTTATVTVANKENSNYAITGSKAFAIGKREVTVNGITAHDKDHDGTTAAVLVFSDVTFGNIVEGDKLTVTAKGAFADAEVGENKTVNITELVLGGASVANYLLAATGNQTTTTASIHAVGTIDRRHSNIQVVRNDNGAAVENDAYLTKMADGTYRIDHVNIIKPADATATNPVSVTIIIPATLKDPDGNTGNTYGLDNDIIQTETFVPVTDMKMPDTGEKALQIAGNHVSCNGTLVTVHTPLQLLDDYAKELSQNVAEKKVVSEVTQTAKDYWTFSSSIDVEFPADIEISIITSFRPTAACKTVLAGRSVPANEAVLLKGKQGETYQIKAIPNVPNAQDFSRNLLVPVPVHKHFEYGVGYYIMMMNTFHAIANDDAEVPSCHAVLFVKGAAAAILDIVDEADLTGISDATRLNDNDENTNDAWYDLNGRKLDKKPVTKGLYIHNGKKVVIK